MSFQLPYFGTLDPKELEERYEVDTEMSGQALSLDVNFDEETISSAKLDLLRLRLETLPALLERARAAVKESFEQGGDATEYIANHVDLITAPELQEALKAVDGALPAEERLFSVVHPVRIGLYPEDEEHYFTFDFSISRKLTQYLIVVLFNVDEKFQYITTES